MRARRGIGARVAIGTVLTGLAAVIAWSCAGELENIEEFRLGASVLRSCFDDENPPKFLTSSKCKQCHLSNDNGIGAALDLTSPNMGQRFTGLIGACPEEALIDPANPAESTLYKYVNDEIDGCTYHKMPPTGAGLSAADKRCLLTWIDGLDNVDDLQDELDDGAADGGADGADGGDGDAAPGDGDTMMDMDPPAPTLADLQADIFDPICSTCHQGGTPPAGLVLGPNLALSTLRANLVNRSSTTTTSMDRIEPNQPANSFLYRKVEGTQGTVANCAGGNCGGRMPANGPPFLTPQQIADIAAWINDGAP